MAKVRVKQGKLWDRGSLGLFTPGMEATIDDSELQGGSALNQIVDIIEFGDKEPEQTADVEVEKSIQDEDDTTLQTTEEKPKKKSPKSLLLKKSKSDK